MKEEAIKAGWKYYFSEVLNLKYAVKDNIIQFEDGVKYYKDETKKLIGVNDINIQNVHNIKKIFNGVLV